MLVARPCAFYSVVCRWRVHSVLVIGPQDNQIMGLEIVAVSLGLCTFVDKLRDTKIVIHCDNTGAEVLPRWCTLALYSLS